MQLLYYLPLRSLQVIDVKGLRCAGGRYDVVGDESIERPLHELMHVSADSVQCMQSSILAWDHIDVSLMYVGSDVRVTLRTNLDVRDM